MKSLFTQLKKGLVFSIRNPQLLYTTFLLVVIPTAFVFTAQMFLDVSRTHQEVLERRGVSLMHDAFVEFAQLHMDQPSALQGAIESIVSQNTQVKAFKVLIDTGDEGHQIVASNNKEEIGTIDETAGIQVLFRDAIPENSKFLPFVNDNERHWAVVREIESDDGVALGIVYTSVSMAWIDAIIASRLIWSYVILGVVVLIIGALLIRQARIIDYAVLYKRLKEVDQMKDDFISMAAHELRTPLTIIRGYTEMLTGSKRLSDTDRQMTTNIEQSAAHLNQLIGDILDVSRLQQGRLSFDMQVVQPHQIIRDVVESLQYTAQQKNLALSHELDERAVIRVDADRLKQVMINIIGNAIKYTPIGSISVRSFVDKDLFTVRVSDTGIGMSAEDQKKLFTRFYRVRSQETESIRGTGLGLWITKEIVTQMNGRISVESIKGKGTDFIIVFPTIKQDSGQSAVA